MFIHSRSLNPIVDSMLRSTFPLVARRQQSIPINLYEDEDHYTLEARVPGIEKSDITLQLKNRDLTIELQSNSEKSTSEEDTENTQFAENGRDSQSLRSSVIARRMVRLPSAIKGDEINAHCENGELIITMPKAESDAKRQITVH